MYIGTISNGAEVMIGKGLAQFPYCYHGNEWYGKICPDSRY